MLKSERSAGSLLDEDSQTGESPKPKPASTGEEADFLDAILAAARYFGRPSNPASVIRILPLAGGRVTSSHLEEAAANAGLAVAVLKTGPSGLRSASLPVIAELADGRVVCILKRTKRGFVIGRADRRHDWMTDAELAAAGLRSVHHVRPAFHFDHRSLHFDLPQRSDWFFGPLRSNFWIYVYAALASTVISAGAAATSMFSMAVYDRVIPNNSLGSLTGLLLGVAIVLVADYALKMVRGSLVDVAAQRFDVEVGANVFARFLALDASERPTSAGSIATLIREFDTIRDFFTSATLLVLADLPFALFFAALIWWLGGPLVYIPIAIAVVLVIAGVAVQWPMAKALQQSFRENIHKSAFVHEVAAGVDTLRAANAQSWARRQWEHFIVQSSDTSQKVRHLTLAFSTLSGSALQVSTVVIVAYGAVLAADQEITTGGIIAATILTGRCLAPFAQISVLMSRWQQTRLAYRAIDRLMKARSEVDRHDALLQQLTIRGDIEFVSTVFAYPAPPGQFAPAQTALAIDRLTIGRGESVGIVGRVGSGKSTLLKLLVRLADPTGGNVKIDGIDLRQIHPAELRRQIGYYGQETTLFHGTVRDNIVLGKPDASDADILAACKIVGLTELLSKNALGLASPVGEAGQRLSGGQRQMVALARALIADPKILLLDEPTSMMDNSTEAAFLQNLQTFREGRTTLIVTHRPQVLAATARVVVIDNGKIVADGPRDQVIASLSAAPRQLRRGA